MNLSELIHEPEILALKPSFGNDFETQVDVALMYSRLDNKSNPLPKSAIIEYVVQFLLNVISENVKPKRKGWKIFWNIVTLGIPLLFKKKA